jgi:hypothetical protein
MNDLKNVLRVLLTVTSISFVIACAPTAPMLDATYTLATLNGQPLPILITISATVDSRSRIDLLTETLALRLDGTFIRSALLRRIIGVDTTATTVHQTGSYSYDRSLVLHFSDGERSTYTFNDDGRFLKSGPTSTDQIHGVLLPALREYTRIEPH